ncbi:GNAT family N-acetyltransferase [Streptomyces boninensis]|uniref:GNAT family N-acetyltransferase n=1 Tax=Streptomyces boninensis TaxID=2039455 RepID=UPI003B21EDD8
MIVRRELPADIPAVRAVTTAAFGKDGAEEPVETWLLDELRKCDGWLPALSLVAEDAKGEITGHVVCTRAHIAGTPTLGLGPISVRPDHQHRGVGLALMHAVLGAADALGEPLVVLLGDPRYYGRYGFVPAADLGIESPDPSWTTAFQARPLTAYDPGNPALKGPFTYAEPFGRL